MRALTVVKYTFSLVGIGLMVAALVSARDTIAFVGDAVTAQGTVVELQVSRSSDSSTYRPVVRFVTRDGQQVEFTASVGSSPPSHSRGEQVEVLYRPDRPHDARINSFLYLWFAPAILAGIGAPFLLVGGGMLLAGVMRGRLEQHLKRHGMPIDTELQGVRLNTSLSVNGRNPYRVVSQWTNPSTSEVHVFESKNLWFDPAPYINNQRIKVLIERRNPKRYVMDLSFLPKLAK